MEGNNNNEGALSAPAPLPPPPTPLLSSESSHASSSKPKEGMSAVFQQINTGNVTSGLRKVRDDMKAKNRADRTETVGASEKDTRVRSQAFEIVNSNGVEVQCQQTLEDGLLMCMRCSFNDGLFCVGVCTMIAAGFALGGRILDLLVLVLLILLPYVFFRLILPLVFMGAREGWPAVQQVLLDRWYSLINPFRQLFGLQPLVCGV
ncbi:hypothetical protein QN277_005056 [Acacia crassicarpa]|uniref:Transmembrane protein n=1 Tax=Acacia crassicarpa TaxID=499986 RepID=A0AAE1MAP5_9FABA|nr:hypothetical protein QN277_005056 [Acacia crassicarpa]